MSTFNTLLFIQAEGQTNEGQPTEGQPEVQQLNPAAPADGNNLDATTTTDPAGQPPADLPKKEDAGWTSWIFILGIVVVFYLFLIRPQSKRAKEERKFRDALKKGDKIVTTAGIHGKILEMEETTVIIETEGQGKLKIEKAAIAKQQSA